MLVACQFYVQLSDAQVYRIMYCNFPHTLQFKTSEAQLVGKKEQSENFQIIKENPETSEQQ